MNKVIENEMKIPLSFSDLEELCLPTKTKFIYYKDLSKYNSIESVFGDNKCIILFINVKGEEIGHFISLGFYNPKSMWVFDSYGFGLKTLLVDRTHNSEELLILLDKFDGEIDENRTRVQKLSKNNSICGRVAAMRCRLDCLTNKQYVHLVNSYKTLTSDELITVMTVFHCPLHYPCRKIMNLTGAHNEIKKNLNNPTRIAN